MSFVTTYWRNDATFVYVVYVTCLIHLLHIFLY